ncbi:hypothetical protein B7P43_G18138 [Cryptotermes secundus]|uniref:Uncharacterized protein n=1 Tax=Cryptotermes secundus TaxID=105785 RepID=A0A2J7QZZ9_9NEOP|nr:hypothetical protein B7P43_G18138 [Cryptotermes secundus]
MCVVEVKVLLLKMLSGMSYVLGSDYVVVDVPVCAGIELLADGDGTDSRISELHSLISSARQGWKLW